MAINTVVEEVAANLEEMSIATRRINTNSVSFFVGGLVVGGAIGFYFGHRWNKEKIKAEAFKASEEEVSNIRDEYQRKLLVASPKPAIEDVVEELGYTAPESKVDYTRPLPAPVPVTEPRPAVVASNNLTWDYEKELQHRSDNPEEPYVIHQEEYMAKDKDYEQKTFTYYAQDDVLVDDENENPLPHADIIVGHNNLQFGHGTDDVDVVFVRNDKLQLEMEICRTNKSYEVEVLGLDPDDGS